MRQNILDWKCCLELFQAVNDLGKHGKGDKLYMNLQHQEPDAKSEDQHYVLRLFVAGTAPNSLRAIQNVRLICEEQLPGRHELEVIDIYQNAGQLATGQVVVAPTLVRQSPLPVRRLVGDLSNRNRVLEGLDIIPPLAPD